MFIVNRYIFDGEIQGGDKNIMLHLVVHRFSDIFLTGTKCQVSQSVKLVVVGKINTYYVYNRLIVITINIFLG
jgi:hypothetical protein